MHRRALFDARKHPPCITSARMQTLALRGAPPRAAWQSWSKRSPRAAGRSAPNATRACKHSPRMVHRQHCMPREHANGHATRRAVPYLRQRAALAELHAACCAHRKTHNVRYARRKKLGTREQCLFRTGAAHCAWRMQNACACRHVARTYNNTLCCVA